MKFLKNDSEFKQRRRVLRRDQTEAEKSFWSKVRNRQFFGLKFFRQYSVGPYVLDFFCPELNLAVELDGGQHAESENQEHDEKRTGYLKKQGIEVLRFWNNDVLKNMDGVLAELEKKVTPRSPLT